ncbi:MAG: hypothetical protein JXR64_13610 [Spirochaetales bacterium]|nr:hypothetical protein [Spirochaetales bacterium]
MNKNLFLIILLNLCIIFAQDIEENNSVFKYDILDNNNLYLSLDGSWKFDLSAFTTGNISSLVENITFTQVPDLNASLWLFNKFFFETEIHEKSEENTFLLGYQNNEGILQEVRIGNSDLNISEYAGFLPSTNINKSPGARFKIETNHTQHEVLGRYTSEIKESVTYIGYNELTEINIDLKNYEYNSYFILPSTNGDIDLYTITNGSSEKISTTDYIYSVKNHTLYLENKDIKNIYLPFKFADENLIENNTITEINGETYIEIYTIGSYSPYIKKYTYNIENLELTTQDTIEISLNNKKLNDYILENNHIIFTDTNEFDSLDIMDTPFILTISKLSPVTLFSVPEDAKENSLSIYINGFPYLDFTHNLSNGEVTIDKEINPFDKVVINYTIDSSPGTGKLLLSYGSRYLLNNNLSLDLSNTLDWSLSSKDYSYEMDENLGEVNSSALLNFTSKYLDVDLFSKINVINNDTTGHYLLFNYNKSEIEIPVTGVEIDQTEIGYEPLLKRDVPTSSILETDIERYEINPIGGAYTMNLNHLNKSSKVFVMENIDIEKSKSSMSLNLKDYSNNYNWADEFNFDLLSLKPDIEVKITFINTFSTEAPIVRNIKTSDSTLFKTYKLNFSKEEQDYLTYIDKIVFSVSEIKANRLFLQNFKFIGDSLFKSNNENYNIVKSDNSLVLIVDEKTNSDISLHSSINSIDISKYNILEFTLNGIESNFFDNIVINLDNGNSVIYKIEIPSSELSNDNSVKINLSDKTIYLNGLKSETSTFTKYNNIEITSINIIISNPDKGSIEIGEFILSEPKYEYNNENRLTFNITPPLSIKYKNFEILDNVKIKIENSIKNNELSTLYTDSGISLTLLGSHIQNDIIYQNELKDFSYSLKIPETESFIYFEDYFSYNDYRYKESTLNLDLKYYSQKITLKDLLGKDLGLRNSNMNIILGDKDSLSINFNTNISQNRDDSLTSLNNEMGRSFISILPTNNIDKTNIVNEVIDLSIKQKYFDFKTTLNGELQQNNLIDRDDSNQYGFLSNITIKPLNFSISNTISTMFSGENSEPTALTITDGIADYVDFFYKNNPYPNITIDKLIFNNSEEAFYVDSIELKRGLESEYKIELSHNYSNLGLISIVIPQLITGSIAKSFSQEYTQNNTLINRTLSADFKLNRLIKNIFTYSDSFKIEDNIFSKTFDWDFFFQKDIANSKNIDFTNSFTITEEEVLNLSKLIFNWEGKSGPLYIVPIIKKVFDAPYVFNHVEMIYFNVKNSIESSKIGIRHETTLNVNSINETNFFIDAGYDMLDDNRLSLELGLYTTLIF